jgi:predicted outer membrane repeat protein
MTWKKYLKPALATLLLFLLTSNSAVVYAKIIYVDTDADGANNGLSWADAFNYLQDALAAADSGDEIRVAQGIYKPDRGIGFTPGDRQAAFQLINGVTLKGSYAGFGESEPDARNVAAYETILTGDLAGNDVEVGDPCDLLTEPTRYENSEHILRVGQHGDNPPVLDGFTITGGSSEYSGGGLVMDESDLIAIDCIFTNNSAGYSGGAMTGWNSRVIFERCCFIRNAAAKDGAGIFTDSCTCRQAYLACIDCKFINNSAAQNGGAVHLSSMITMVTSCINCLFVGNRAGGYGGALYDYTSDGTISLVNCTLSGNSTDGTEPCGGSGYSSMTLTSCILWENQGQAICSDEIGFKYSDVEDGPTGDGNIDADPCFVDPGYWDADGLWIDGDYRLLPDSPCINAGDPDFVAAPHGLTIPEGDYYIWEDSTSGYIALSSETDVDGNPRVIGGRIDMGAYEFWHEPKIIYVDDDAPGGNNGSSWIDAFNYIQDALAAAYSGDEIRVAQGVYKPDQGAGITPSDREATFQLINGVAVRGGYAGFGEPDPNARDIKLYETILTGDLYDNDGFYFVGKEENSYHIVTGSGTDATAVLDGFNIRYGHANRQADPWGAGMYNDNGSPTVKNCVFISNHAFAEQGSMGGGMYNYRSSPALINCAFIANFADVTDKNQAGGNGGGMCNNLSSPTLTNCTFRSNGAREYGGGMYNIDSNTTLTYSTLQANRASLYGGGMYNYRSTLTLTKCMLIGNWTYGDTGGAMYSDVSDTIMTNCTLTQNSGTNGSSLACDSPGQLHPSSVQMTNCILWDSGNEIWNNDNSSVIMSYSDVRCGWTGLGNISDDPLFVNPGGVENFRLAESSPCIDAGDPNYIPEPNETDFDGKPRIVGGRIDMGVYEFQGRLILYVDNDAPGGNNGSSWADAYNCLQDALIPADPTGGPVEIRVAEGIYKPDQGDRVTPGDRAAAFRIKARVTVKGGYAGFGQPDPNARNIKIYETILTGDLNGNDSPNFKNNDENSYHVVTSTTMGEITGLDGFTITGGNADGSSWNDGQGGGIRLGQDRGFTIINCTIFRNRAEYNGGGISTGGGSSCCIPITNCRFISNSAGRAGGGIYMSGESLPDISNCIFSGNSAVTGGAIYNYEAYPNIINCTFTGNRALDECGGVIDLDGISGFENCILWGNTDAGGADESAQIGWSNPMSINFSCIQGWTGALGGIGNINEDPRFVRPGFWKTEDLWIDGDYHLLLDSPCINAGDPDYIPEPNETDLDGNPRVMDGRIDMGAYEYGGAMSAEVDIEPNTLNLQSKGKWITAFLQLGEDYNVAYIDPDSVFLEGDIGPDRFWITEDEQVAVAKFDRSEVQAILNVGEVELTITGRLTDGTAFQGTDIIKVIDKAGEKPPK